MAARLELALVVSLLAACRNDPPEPKKVAEVGPVVKPKVRPERKGPFSDPNVDPPGPRAETQLPAKELETTIARGIALAAEGRETVAIQTLRKCANRIPQSVLCEAEIGLTMFAANQHLAHARYYLAQAATAAPAQEDDALYRRMGEMAMSKSQHETAAAAYGVLMARDKATADDLEQLAAALQSGSGRRDEAADAYARAYALDATRHELLRKRATLLGQGGEHGRAADLFEEYLEKAAPDEKLRTAIEQRVLMLREEAKSDPAPGADTKPTDTKPG
jgi:tetratricopeptide (TPR) repeat protein